MKKFTRILTGRVARNIYFWLFNIWLIWNINQNNAISRYLDIDSPWFYRILIGELCLLLILSYVNNLLLVPRLLVKKKYTGYFISAALLICSVVVLHVALLKAGAVDIDIAQLQQLGIMSMKVSDVWTVTEFINDSIAYLIGHTAWVFLFTAAWFMNDYSRQRKIAEEAKQKQVEAELHFLKNQVNPHFLFNTLNNLYGLALKKSDKSPDAILRLSSILRYLLYESNVDKVYFDKEKELMMAYIDLELLRLPESDDFHFTITADDNYRIPPLLWLPILENIFKHATRVISDKYFIDYSFIIENGIMTISSKNNYKSVLNGEVKKTGGIGLENLKKRLALLYPGKHSLTYGQEDKFYVVEVKIDIA